jgi:hypothetical protein
VKLRVAEERAALDPREEAQDVRSVKERRSSTPILRAREKQVDRKWQT